jgi:hypothetical protein
MELDIKVLRLKGQFKKFSTAKINGSKITVKHLLRLTTVLIPNLLFLLFFCSSAFAYTVGTTVNVVDTITLNLNISGNTVPFNPITYATMGSPDAKPYTSVAAYTNNNQNTNLMMTSTIPADAAGNPQLKDSSVPANYIPYSVSFQPCYRPASQPIPPTYSLKVGLAQTISMPYSLFSACFTPGGGKLGVITFTRLPLTSLPVAGAYSGTLLFTLSEI